ncbi:Maf family protein [Blautia sp. HCP3S3_G3]|uniref:Maf family protein n=1 Tax=Blautia sp. HCP3S3_G3 TaxID=3438913 RepID=UPI003F89E9BE
MKKIILASASPRRKELLEKAGISFEIITGTGEEKTNSSDPEEMVKELSYGKAESVAENVVEDAVIIGADTIVFYDGCILGKPKDAEDAVETLLKLQGNTHQVYTGVTVLIKEGGNIRSLIFAECTDVTFYPVSENEIRAYVNSGEPMDKAGSYGIQGAFGVYVKGICGDYSNVVGLPVARLLYETKKQGIDLRGWDK